MSKIGQVMGNIIVRKRSKQSELPNIPYAKMVNQEDGSFTVEPLPDTEQQQYLVCHWMRTQLEEAVEFVLSDDSGAFDSTVESGRNYIEQVKSSALSESGAIDTINTMYVESLKTAISCLIMAELVQQELDKISSKTDA